MRFRKRTKLFPGVYLNFSKSGISTTIGVPGLSVNVGEKGTYLNTGIPGTGLYDRQKIGGRSNKKYETPILQDAEKEVEKKEIISTIDFEEITTKGLKELKKILSSCYKEREELKRERARAKSQLTFSTILLIVSYVLIVGFFIKWFKNNRIESLNCVSEIQEQIENCKIDIDIKASNEIDKGYQSLIESYRQIVKSDKIWDITSTSKVDKIATRSSAGIVVSRKQVNLTNNRISIIKSKYEPLCFENANGGDLYIYPAFMVMMNSEDSLGLLDIRELEFNFKAQRFVEEESVPKDAVIVDQTWAKTNKNGSRDKRFRDNYQIPVCKYGDIEFKSNTGLNEAYSISSYKYAKQFAIEMENYQNLIT
ncbi:MAG: DUF4236 domain-containing protein [Flavobacteriales bacterium]|nr:DUF4236 domain-containing protein [Flavobacteriales bacterium]